MGEGRRACCSSETRGDQEWSSRDRRRSSGLAMRSASRGSLLTQGDQRGLAEGLGSRRAEEARCAGDAEGCGGGELECPGGGGGGAGVWSMKPEERILGSSTSRKAQGRASEYLGPGVRVHIVQGSLLCRACAVREPRQDGSSKSSGPAGPVRRRRGVGERWLAGPSEVWTHHVRLALQPLEPTLQNVNLAKLRACSSWMRRNSKRDSARSYDCHATQ
jgi:hypothetical protein